MPMDALAIDPAMRATFSVVHTSDPGALEGTIRVIERTAEPSRFYKYQLQDRALWPMQFEIPIFIMASRNAGSTLATYLGNRFVTDISIDGEDGDLFCFTAPLQGKTTLINNGESTTATGSCGIAFRPGPGTRLQISDNNARTNVFLRSQYIETTEFPDRHFWHAGYDKALLRRARIHWRNLAMIDEMPAVSIVPIASTTSRRRLPRTTSDRSLKSCNSGQRSASGPVTWPAILSR